MPADADSDEAEVRLFVDSRGMRDDLRIALPVAIVSSAHAERQRAPSLGAARQLEVWSAVAGKTGLDLVGTELVGQCDGASIRVRHTTERGAGVLLAELGWPDLVRHEPSRGLPAVTTGRDPVQTAAFLAAVAAAGAPVGAVDAFRDDHGALLRRAGGSRDAEALEALARDALALAAGVARTRIVLRMDQVIVVRHKVLVEKQSRRAVARELGLSRLTIKRYLEGRRWAFAGRRRGRTR